MSLLPIFISVYMPPPPLKNLITIFHANILSSERCFNLIEYLEYIPIFDWMNMF